jgi:glucokinase
MLSGMPIITMLRKQYPNAVITLHNDGNAHAIGILSLPGMSQNAWCCALGSGVGAGFTVNGQLVEGPLGNAAEAGHWPMRRYDTMPVTPMPCGCGNNDCI